MRRGGGRFGRAVALGIAATLGIFGGAGQRALPLANSIQQPVKGKDTAPPPAQAPSGTIVSLINLRTAGGLQLYRNSSFIWNGVAKRGNRRGRSRWNYNR